MKEEDKIETHNVFSFPLLQEIGTGIDAYTASICVGMTRLCMSILNAYLLKKFKRRPLVMVSAVGMSICMFTSGLFTMWIKDGTTELTWVPVVCLLLYVAFSMFGLLTVPWTMTAELFPTAIRGIAHSISYSMANVLMFIAIQSYRTISQALGGAYAIQWLFSGVSIAGFFFGLFFLPETHGKKLKDIEEHFMGKKTVKKSASTGPRKGSATNRVGKNSLKAAERKISRTSLPIVPEMEQMIVDSERGKKLGKEIV